MLSDKTRLKNKKEILHFITLLINGSQPGNFGKKITEFEQQNNFGVEFSDDVVQNLFEKDTNYLKIYNQEVQKFYQSIQNKNIDSVSVKDGLKLMSLRQSKYFKGNI